MGFKSLSLVIALGCGAAYGAETYQSLPSSCRNLADGEHFVQPLDSSTLQLLTGDDSLIAHPINVVCSNGYMIIDPIKDENTQLYFSSFHKYHYAFAGPDLNDHVIWTEWWLPSRYDSSLNENNEEDENGIVGSYFTIADDCNTCSDASTANYPYETSFYMTGDLFGCNWSNKNLCGFDLDTLECQICTNTFFDDEIMSDWGSCGHLPAKASHSIQSNHDSCSTNGYMLMPSIGVTETETSNKYCVCYRPSENMASYMNTDLNDFDITSQKTKEEETIDELFDSDASRVVHLSQSDFTHGTYRIRHPGKYTLTEDIILDFNSPTDEDLQDEDYSVNDDETAWFPTSDQSDEYPGATELDGWYWLGFYAGITIEADDVILDLNGHSISMSYAFYLQQRWFVTILVANKPFIDTQGPTWTGAGFAASANTLIKNGIVGLSSHHGILALNASNCILEDLQIRDFETHGLAVNEFHSLEVKNVEIGPSSRYVYLNGMYNLARMELPLFRSALEDYSDEVIEFKVPKMGVTKKKTFEQLYNRLIKYMDYAFNYVYNGITYDSDYDDYSEFNKAITMFVNPSGISPHGVVYGAVFRPRGASIQNFGRLLSTETKSSDLYIDNLEIHDLAVDVKEYFAMQGKTERWIRDPINGVLPLSDATSGFDGPLDDLVYIGNAWTDIVIALKYVSDSWWHLGRMAMSDDVVNWARSGERLGIFYKTESISTPRYCNMDALGHLVKGMLGIRMEWVEDAKITDLNIHDLFTLSDLGNSELCGEYVGSGHPVQSSYSNPGYGGINNYGIMLYEVSNAMFDTLNIENLVSYNGPVVGIKQFKLDLANALSSTNDEDASETEEVSPDITLKNVAISNFFAGTQLSGTDGKQTSWPNSAARACALPETDDYYIDNGETPQVSCLSGKTTCMCGSESCFGEYSKCESAPSITTPYHTIHFKMGSFDNEDNEDYETLDATSTTRPSKLTEILSSEPERIDSDISDDDSNSQKSLLLSLASNFLPKNKQLSVENDNAFISNSHNNTVSLFNKQATWIGMALIIVTLSILSLLVYNKCENGEYRLNIDSKYIQV